jgi:hypothetical protein
MQTGSGQKKPNRRAWCAQPPSGYKRPPHFCPDQRAEGAGNHAGGMQPRQVDALLRLLTRQLGGPGPRVKQPAHQLLHASNRTATCATVAPLRLRSLCRDSRRPTQSRRQPGSRPVRGQQGCLLPRRDDGAPVTRSSNGSRTRNGRPANHSPRRINSAAGHAAPLAGEAGDASPSP